MSDLISREAAIDALGKIHPLDYNGQAILEKINALPSAKDIDVSNKVRKEKKDEQRRSDRNPLRDEGRV